MSDIPPAITSAPPVKERGVSHWRSRARRHPLSEDDAARQGSVSNYAFVELGKERALAFLNHHYEQFDGQPLAIATASVTGEARVIAEIDRLAAEDMPSLTISPAGEGK